MVKQLYYSKIHSKNIKIYLSKLYVRILAPIDVIKYVHTKTLCLLIALMVGTLLIYITCACGFCV